MKRLATSLLTLLFVLALTSPVSANHNSAHHWEVRTSEPQSTSQERTFNLEFVTLSTDADDDITVTLFQDGVNIGTQTTTKAYGDSGAFTVTVPSDGQYEYTMTATNGSESLNTSTRTVDVQGREVRVISEGDSTDDASVVNPASTESGDDDNAGQVDNGAATDENNPEGVLGEQDEKNLIEKVADTLSWPIWLLLAILAGIYYWFFYRTGRANPFNRGEE